jgi:hypothetical protein
MSFWHDRHNPSDVLNLEKNQLKNWNLNKFDYLQKVAKRVDDVLDRLEAQHYKGARPPFGGRRRTYSKAAMALTPAKP